MYRPRFLIHGNAGNAQSQLAAALLYSLEEIPVSVLSMAALFSNPSSKVSHETFPLLLTRPSRYFYRYLPVTLKELSITFIETSLASFNETIPINSTETFSLRLTRSSRYFYRDLPVSFNETFSLLLLRPSRYL